ncbi:MAG: thioredoxin domain-containing protein [Deltaproteobacteria bacterium]|nr:thioredoxin domain-containing protein [Deltaproteobacteria bacterium]
MTRLPLVAVLASATMSCGDADKVEKLERQVDSLEEDLAQERKERRRAERKVEGLREEVDRLKDVEKRLDDMRRKADALAARPAPTPPRRTDPDPDKVYGVPVNLAILEGSPAAKVTIVWAYDYACPFCERARGTMLELRRKYGADVRIAYEQFVVHPTTAGASARAACAASRQGRFARFDEVLWEKSFKARRYDGDHCWTSPAGCPVMNDLAREAGLDPFQLQRDMSSCDVMIRDQERRLRDFGISATPTFFINGRYISGAQPLASFVKIVDEELMKASDRIMLGTRAADYYQQWVIDRGLARHDPHGP